MYLYVNRATRQICDASNRMPWIGYLNPATHEIIEKPDVRVEAYPWPARDPIWCRCAADGTITADQTLDRDDVRDAYVAAKEATTDFAADSTLAKARTAIIRQGQCLEALLLYLNKRIS